MLEDNPFRDLINHRVRAGEEAAATELVRTYEPAIPRAVRIRLTDSRLKRLMDMMDICQSVMASFFVRAALGQYQLDTPEHLLKLLVTMARNKLNNQANRERTQRRDPRHARAGAPHEAPPVASPSQVVATRELLEKFREQLTEEERLLADQRALGREWSEIAAEQGGNPEALRKRLARAVDRVAQRLGLDE